MIGDLVALRQLGEEDVPALHEIFSDPEVMRFWSSPPLADLEAARRLLAEIEGHRRAGTLFQWGVVTRHDDRVVGTCTLFRIEEVHRRAEVGFALARRVWGRGLMSEALALLLRHCFDTLGLQRLEADVDPRNERSLRVLEQHGFRREGLLRERYRVGGEVQDSVILGLLPSWWTRR